MRRALPFLLLAAAVLAAPARAHVGSPNVFYDGVAGPYPVRVIVRPPAVIPGDAEITVRLLDGRGVDRVSIQPLLYTTGFKGAPPPDEARPVPGAPGVWSGRFLLMKDGSWNMRVHVQGPEGEGTAQVPVPAVRSQIFTMGKELGVILAGLGLFLFVGAVSIVGAAAREGSLPPGETAGVAQISRGRAASVFAALVLALVVWGGKSWWESTDAALRKKIFEPFGMKTAARLEGGRSLLALTIDDPRTKDWPPLMPDHGKLMHLFVLREPGLDAFAHLHPVPQGQKDFLAALPPLPPGTYRVYADIVDENGFPQTLVDRVKIAAAAPSAAQEAASAAPSPDPDDSWHVSTPLRAVAAGPQTSPLEDGGSMLWRPAPLAANQEITLTFEVRGPDGRSAPLEPYMGMLGHSIISRDDGEVFVHLHPMGTASMAAQQMFLSADTRAVPAMDHAAMGHAMPGMDHARPAGAGADGVLSFPYEFPQPGRYRLWVQVKSQGRVLTGVFAADVGK